MALDSLVSFRSYHCYVKDCKDHAPFSMIWQTGEFIEICDKHYDMARYYWDQYQIKETDYYNEVMSHRQILKTQFEANVRQIRLEP